MQNMLPPTKLIAAPFTLGIIPMLDLIMITLLRNYNLIMNTVSFIDLCKTLVGFFAEIDSADCILLIRDPWHLYARQ